MQARRRHTETVPRKSVLKIPDWLRKVVDVVVCRGESARRANSAAAGGKAGDECLYSNVAKFIGGSLSIGR